MPTRLFVDANILVRCTVGRAAFAVDELLSRNVVLATTDAQAREAARVLETVFAFDQVQASIEVEATVSAMELYAAPAYRARQAEAQARMHYKNTSDWPLLAAAMIDEGAIWTDDRDFFGTGVATWTTRNIRFAGQPLD